MARAIGTEVRLIKDEVPHEVKIIRTKVRAFAALTVPGEDWPPAPSEFMAPHSPGARNEQMPRMVA